MNSRLSSTLLKLGLGKRKSLAEVLDAALTPEPWVIGTLSYDGQSLKISGWALAPQGRHESLTFTVNDREFEEITFPLPLPDVANIFWYKPGADRTGFVCRSSLTPAELFADGVSVLKCVDRNTGLPVSEDFNIYFPDDKGPELPDEERRARVWGTDASTFLLEGFSTFKKLDLALRRTTNRGLSDFVDILDWGCGCGRVTRNFYQLPKAQVVGIDVDEDNVNWCRDHLEFGKYKVAPLYPPTDLADRSFDLLIGISVFTHLRSQAQRDWLAELWRLARPGAVLLMSTCGEASAARSYWNRAHWSRWQKTGFQVGENSPNAEPIIADEDYYVTTFLTEEYIRRNWSRTFEIVDILPAYISNHQDLVVMRKRS